LSRSESSTVDSVSSLVFWAYISIVTGNAIFISNYQFYLFYIFYFVSIYLLILR
jgi:hypothetical protein